MIGDGVNDVPALGSDAYPLLIVRSIQSSGEGGPRDGAPIRVDAAVSGGRHAFAAIVLGDGAQADAVARHVARLLHPVAREQVINLVLRTRRDSPLLLAIAVASMGGRALGPPAWWSAPNRGCSRSHGAPRSR